MSWAECDDCDPIKLLQERYYPIEEIKEVIRVCKDLIKAMRRRHNV